ncbi:MAG: colanic acid biosynthesis glycosyltransferase WcaL [Chloroflexi bacterium]|nr:colanic acid biosynthesis glycosyltransferase WcaL [Chloroflexota bacterium]
MTYKNVSVNNLSLPLTVAHSVLAWLPLTEIWLYRQIKNMNKVRSIVLSRQLVHPEQFPCSPLYTISKQWLFLFKVSRRLGYRWLPANYNKAVQEHQVKILHSHFGHIGWYDVPLAAKHNLKQIVTFYGADVNMWPKQRPVWRTRYQDMFAWSDLFLCEGPYMAQSLVELGCPKEKVRVQRLGVDVDEIAYIPRKMMPGESLKILIAGTFREKKGMPYALEAVGQLYRKGIDVQVTIIGDSGGYERDEIEKRKILDVIARYDMQTVVRLLGYQPYARLLAEAYKHHIFMSPSVKAADGDTEGGAPVTLIDLMASGMPIISTSHCDIPQIVQHGRTGLLASERNVDELVTHLQWLIDHPQKWEELTARGRQHIETNFNARIQAIIQENIYKEILQ